MPAIITVQGLAKSFGAREVLKGVSFAIDTKDRIAVVGVNGSGKSTLLHLVATIARGGTDDELDAGVITKRRELSLEYVPQEPQLLPELTITDTLKLGLRGHAELTERIEQLERQLPSLAGEPLAQAIDAHASLHARLTALGGLARDHEVAAVAAALGLPDPLQRVGELSLGERRRVALGQALLARPDVLALDEPTNHLDTGTIEWLEQALLEQPGALLLVTHDRYFLDRVATRIIEIDRGHAYSYEGGYERFLQLQQARLEAASEEERVRRAFVRRELEWIRRGPQARATKQKARIDRFEQTVAIEHEAAPNERVVTLRLPPGPRLGKTVLELRGLCKSVGSKPLFDNLDLLVKPGDRIGIVGPNGAGKTTLVRTILGLQTPDRGEIVVGHNTRFAYLDQARAALDDSRSVLEEVAGDSEHVYLEHGPIHVRTFLRMLLFDDRLLGQRVGQLSGGERNRVQLAKLLREGGNFLVLDEPTNDLDVITLGVLETALLDFPGCALVVSHDRWFLDRIATAILAFEAGGDVRFYEGNYTHYIDKWGARQRSHTPQHKAPKKPSQPTAKPPRAKKLSFHQQRELDGMETSIEAAEAQVAKLEATLSAPDLYANRGAEVPGLVAALDEARAEVERLYARWQELEGLQIR